MGKMMNSVDIQDIQSHKLLQLANPLHGRASTSCSPVASDVFRVNSFDFGLCRLKIGLSENRVMTTPDEQTQMAVYLGGTNSIANYYCLGKQP